MRIFRFIFFLFISIIFLGATGKKDKKGPDDMIQINDSTFIDKYEVTIRTYSGFLLSKLQKGNINSLDNLLPVPNAIDWYDGFWHYHCLYMITDSNIGMAGTLWERPIVNITKKQAEEFCDWLTENWQQVYSKMPEKDKERYYKDLVFRLPDQWEWISAASSGLDTAVYPTGISKQRKKNSFPICAEYFSRQDRDSGEVMPQGGDDNSLGQFGIKNDKGIFNMCGDVAEFVRDKNFVVGGSFRDSLNHCKVSSTEKFDGPNDCTGFRCVAIVRHKNPR